MAFLLVDPRVRACAATGARQRRHIGPPSRTTTTTAAAAAAGAGRCGGRCGGRATGRGAGLVFRGPGGARPPRHATTAAAAAVFVQLALRWGATGQLSGIRLGLWASASGGAAQSASMFMGPATSVSTTPAGESAALLASWEGPSSWRASWGALKHLFTRRNASFSIDRIVLRCRGSLAQEVFGRVSEGSALGCLFSPPPQWGAFDMSEEDRDIGHRRD